MPRRTRNPEALRMIGAKLLRMARKDERHFNISRAIMTFEEAILTMALAEYYGAERRDSVSRDRIRRNVHIFIRYLDDSREDRQLDQFNKVVSTGCRLYAGHDDLIQVLASCEIELDA